MGENNNIEQQMMMRMMKIPCCNKWKTAMYQPPTKQREKLKSRSNHDRRKM